MVERPTTRSDILVGGFLVISVPVLAAAEIYGWWWCFFGERPSPPGLVTSFGNWVSNDLGIFPRNDAGFGIGLIIGSTAILWGGWVILNALGAVWPGLSKPIK